MRKILSKKSFLASLLLALMFVCTAFGMAGCKKDKGDTSSAPESSSSESSVAEITYTLSFETNGGTPVPSVTVKEGETVLGSIIYSPMTYCSNVLSDGTQSEALQNVCKALYLYAEAADSYFPN
jgi:hypothetical protein